MTLEDAVYAHRMRDTFSGYDWGDPIRLWAVQRSAPEPVKQPRMSWEELLPEIEWLRDSGCQAWEVAQAVGLSCVSLSRRCYRRGRADLGVWFDAEVKASRSKEMK